MEEAVTTWIENTLKSLEAESKEEVERLKGEGKKVWRGAVQGVERGLGGHVMVTVKEVGNAGGGQFSKGVPVVVRKGEEGIRGVLCRMTESTFVISLDADEWDVEWDEATLTVIPIHTDVTYKAMRHALLGGGSGFGTFEGDALPLKAFTHENFIPLDILKLAFGEDAEPNHSPTPETDFTKFFVPTLNPSQQAAVRAAVANMDQGGLKLVLGPPGTGKTETVAEIIRQFANMKKKVLVATPSNVAADNIVSRLCVGGPIVSDMRVVRLGHSGRLSEDLMQFSMDWRMGGGVADKEVRTLRLEIQKVERKLRKKGGKRREMYAELRGLNRDLRGFEKEKEREVADHANVVVGTLVNTTKHCLRSHRFDLIVVDEACMALEASTWIPLLKATPTTTYLLAGDPFQLPPTVLSSSTLLTTTLFERIYARHRSALTTTLITQYRMNSVISAWSSAEFYSSELEADGTVADHLLADLGGVTDTLETASPFTFVDTTDCGYHEVESESGSKTNIGEVNTVVSYVGTLLEAGVPPTCIAVISPYTAQVRLLKEALPTLEVGTIDSFQGREQEAVIISLVRSNPDGEIGFLSEYRRLNVAITRGRRHVALIGSAACLSRDPFMKRLISYIEEHGLVLPA